MPFYYISFNDNTKKMLDVLLRDYSQQTIANFLNVNHSTVYRWTQNQQTITPKNASEIKNCYDAYEAYKTTLNKSI